MANDNSTPRPRFTQFFASGYGVVEIFAILDRWDFLSEQDKRDLRLWPISEPAFQQAPQAAQGAGLSGQDDARCVPGRSPSAPLPDH